jgi:hypothetical protein
LFDDFLGEPPRRFACAPSGYPQFASLIPARFALGTHFVRRYYPSRRNLLPQKALYNKIMQLIRKLITHQVKKNHALRGFLCVIEEK